MTSPLSKSSAEEMGQASVQHVQEKWDAIEKEIKATMDRHVP